ncbi:hypothetical protein ACH4SP_03175 [Streptomyces sp. NPDC021093]
MVLFTRVSAGTRGPAVSAAFADSIWYVVGTLLTMWVLMHLLPRVTRSG